MVIYVELAAKRDGTLTGLKLRNLANMGAYLHSASAIPPTFILNMASGCYRIPNVRVETSAIFTNTPSTGPYRGAGRPESVLALERGMDRLAAELGIDPIELRRKNFIQPDEFPYRTATGRRIRLRQLRRGARQGARTGQLPRAGPAARGRAWPR